MALLDTVDRLIRRLRNNAPMGWRSSWAWEENGGLTSNSGFISIGDAITESAAKLGVKDERLEAKPKDVMHELYGEVPDVNFEDLDKKIKAIRKRRDFIKNELERQSPEEDQALLWLEARKEGKKYLKEFKWPVTTEAKVTVLLRRYKLTKAAMDSYHLAVPAEAVDQMEVYYKLWRKVVKNKKEKPEFIVLADIPKEQKQYARKDPILLATSPFGKYYFILGAWDKEVAIMHELFFPKKLI